MGGWVGGLPESTALLTLEAIHRTMDLRRRRLSVYMARSSSLADMVGPPGLFEWVGGWVGGLNDVL